MPPHQAQTDEIKKIELPSSIQQVYWNNKMAAPGANVILEIFTHFVGNGAEVSIEISEESGKKHWKTKQKIMANQLRIAVQVPENAKDLLYATVELPKHSLKQKSGPLLVLPKIEISNAKWDKQEARRGDILKLTADVKGATDGSEAEIEIWEHDADEAHDLITKFPVLVNGEKIEAEWEFEYHEDTDDIPTEEESEKGYNPPEYFFRVRIGEVSADSGLLEFKDWIEIELRDEDGNPIPDEDYVIKLPDGKEKKGKLDENGYTIEENIPPGRFKVEFPNLIK